ncbi:tetratricopeptide repeat protein, partial [candidate division WOR-3 bacterium]|nr:tetratricopeptide repeat protein [candidate division WOR-3 bacterium]
RYNLGKLYIELDRYEEGIIELETVLVKHPEDFDIRIFLGDAYAAIGKCESAREQYGYVVEQSPEYAPCWLRLGNVYVDEKKYDDAVMSYKKAIEIDSLQSSYCYHLIDLLVKLKRWNEASTELERGFRISPGDAILVALSGDLYMSRADASYKAKNWGSAITNYQRAINEYNKIKGLTQEAHWIDYATKGIDRARTQLKKAEEEKWWDEGE